MSDDFRGADRFNSSVGHDVLLPLINWCWGVAVTLSANMLLNFHMLEVGRPGIRRCNWLSFYTVKTADDRTTVRYACFWNGTAAAAVGKLM